MCGIVAFLYKNAKNYECFITLINSLKVLENRGYDSCGLIDSNFKCLLRAVKNKTDAIKQLLLQKDKFPKLATIGIAHTRWATSGKKTVNNSHPHLSYDNNIAIIHNGIIENYEELKKDLIEDKYFFRSETDTEVISNWMSRDLSLKKNFGKNDIIKSLEKANTVFKGSWAIVMLHKKFPHDIFVSRNGNPLLIGFNTLNGTIMVSSEVYGFVNKVNKYTILDDKRVISLNSGDKIDNIIKKGLLFYDVLNKKIELSPGKFPYFMAKEIYEQKNVVNNPCYWNKYKNIEDIKELKQLDFLKKNKKYDVLLVACGTSYHSCLSSRTFFIGELFRSVRCVIASEFTKYDLSKGNNLVFFLSQSGETLDTYRALKKVKEYKIPTVAVVNVENSLIARECDYQIYLHAGREVGVASTKAYVTQIIALKLVSMYLQNYNGVIPDDFYNLSNQINIILKKYFSYFPEQKNGKHLFFGNKKILKIVNSLDECNHGFVLSSGLLRATAYEGSLKIKEVGRVFIQGYPTASLKHGPFALIDEKLPIIFILQKEDEDVLRRTTSAIEEVYLRGADIFLITDIEDYENEKVNEIIKVPYNKTFSSILSIIPFQIISYFLSGIRGLNCDKPVNLAKCVTTD